MPKAIEEKLKKQAAKMMKDGKLHKPGKAGMNAYVYGTLNKLKKQYGVA